MKIRTPYSPLALFAWQRDDALIAGIAMQVVEEFSADPTRVYVGSRQDWRHGVR